jgi:hypothetical protein
MLAHVSERSVRPIAVLFQDLLRFVRSVWERFSAPTDATLDSSIDWEDGESR